MFIVKVLNWLEFAFLKYISSLGYNLCGFVKNIQTVALPAAFLFLSCKTQQPPLCFYLKSGLLHYTLLCLLAYKHFSSTFNFLLEK